MEEQKFDISIDRVEKIPVPLLVIGLGGTGRDAVIEIKKTFAERYVLPRNQKGQELPAPKQTAYLVIDSETLRPRELEVGEYIDISLAGMEKILKNQKELLTPFERTWVNPKLNSVSAGIGMGTIRQAARLALSHNYDTVSTALRGALNNIVSVTAGSSDGRANQVEIVLITGIGGGTGSGIFLDMCQIIRAAARATTVIPASITGYIVMPDVSLSRVSSASGMEGPIKHNAYAALKELDFWMRVREHGAVYQMQYGNGVAIDWKEPPFDHCILMSSSNVEGIPYRDGYSAVMSTIAENLMHYMAEETSAAGEAYSYRQYEDNLEAIGNSIRRSYPLYYGYRAIGAFTKRIPKKSILYYEGSLLLKTFIPLRDDSGKIQPDRRMFTDGKGKNRAENITGNGPQLMQDFRTNICKLPGFCNMDLTDRVKVTAVASMNPPPHNKWHTWRDTVSSPAAIQAADNYLEKAWARFEDWATEVMMDPAQGPFALEAYLDDPNGLLSFMNEIYESWTAQYQKTRNTLIQQGQEMCNNAWPAFRNPPVLGRMRALEQYDHAIRSLYTYVCNCEFLEKHTEALRKLILRVKEYLKDGLKPLCATILYLEKEFNAQDQSDAVLVQDIYDLSLVKNSIDATFTEENANDRLSCEFLRNAAEISMQTAPNVDAKSSGVTFVSRQVGLGEMCRVLQAGLENTYGSVNNSSLDEIMVANVGDDISAQQQWMGDLANSTLNSALPMFMQDAVFKEQDKAAYSYMSIPQNASEHLKYIDEAFRTHDPAVQPKASTLLDHMYVLMAWDKLGLFRYGMFEDLRTVYDRDLEISHGIHLVRTGNGEDYTTDWSLLPSPKPYFLFPGYGVPSERAQYERVHDLVYRAIDCGMITVDSSQPYAQATVNLLCVSGTNTVMSSETLMEKVQEIEREKNPATGDVYPRSEIRARLAKLLEGGRKTELKEIFAAPANIASVLGIQHEPCDPFDPNIQGDINRLRQAKENHKRLCVAMTEAMVYARPDLVRALQIQLPAYEAIAGRIGEGDLFEQLWKARQAYAETAADLFLFLNDVIFQGGKEYRYKEKGNKFDIISPGILAEDLKQMDSGILKVACFLSDAPADNAAKADLTRLLAAAKRDYEDAVENEEMTLEEMEDLMTASADCIAELKDDQTDLQREIHQNPARKDELQPQIELADEMIRSLESWNRVFRKIKKGLN